MHNKGQTLHNEKHKQLISLTLHIIKYNSDTTIGNSLVPVMLHLISLSLSLFPFLDQVFYPFSFFFFSSSDPLPFVSLPLIQLQSLLLFPQLSYTPPKSQGYFSLLYQIPPHPYRGTLTFGSPCTVQAILHVFNAAEVR